MVNDATRTQEFLNRYVVEGRLNLSEAARTELTDLLKEAGFQKSGECCMAPFVRGDYSKGQEVSYLVMGPRNSCECNVGENRVFGVPCSLALITFSSNTDEENYRRFLRGVEKVEQEMEDLVRPFSPGVYATIWTGMIDLSLAFLGYMATALDMVPLVNEWSPRTLTISGVAAGVFTVLSWAGLYRGGRQNNEEYAQELSQLKDGQEGANLLYRACGLEHTLFDVDAINSALKK